MFTKGSFNFAMENIFSRAKYVVAALVFAFIFYVATVFLFHLPYVTYASLSEPFKFLFSSFFYFVKPSTFYMAIVISFLTGIMFALLLYRYDGMKTSSANGLGLMASIGVLFGLAAPGCAACGVGLAVALGLGSSIASLPLMGAEISVLSILLLCYSINRIGNSFLSCELK